MTTLAEALQLKLTGSNTPGYARTNDEPLHLNAHYRKSELQPWDIIDAWNLNFYEGNVLKYLLRAKHKGTQYDDYVKAKHYLQRLIENMEADHEYNKLGA